MDALTHFLAMGKYAAFVWPAYALAVLVLGGLLWTSLRALRAREAEVTALEAARPERRRGAGTPP